MPTSDEGFDFDIALSFAGEERSIAARLASLLRENGVRVFYDEYEQATLWGKNLYDHLAEVYSRKAKFCVVILSGNYSKKAWTSHERQHAQARAFKESQEYILPLRVDDTSIPGIPDTVGYIDLRKTTIEIVAGLVLSKLGLHHEAIKIPQHTTQFQLDFQETLHESILILNPKIPFGRSVRCMGLGPALSLACIAELFLTDRVHCDGKILSVVSGRRSSGDQVLDYSLAQIEASPSIPVDRAMTKLLKQGILELSRQIAVSRGIYRVVEKTVLWVKNTSYELAVAELRENMIKRLCAILIDDLPVSERTSTLLILLSLDRGELILPYEMLQTRIKTLPSTPRLEIIHSITKLADSKFGGFCNNIPTDLAKPL